MMAKKLPVEEPLTEEVLIEEPMISLPPRPLFKQLAAVAGVFVLVLGLGVAVKLSQKSQETRSKASANMVDLSLSPEKTTYTQGENVNIAVGINTHAYKVTGVELHLNYDAERLEYVSITKGDFFPTKAYQSSTSGTITFKLMSDYENPPIGSGIIANVVLKAKVGVTGGTALVKVDQSTQVAGLDANYSPISTNLLGDAGETTLTIPREVAVVEASPSPTTTTTVVPVATNHPIAWFTDYVTLTADDFYIKTGDGKYFYGPAQIDGVTLFSVPNDLNNTTFEATWRENDQVMKLNFYFKQANGLWWSSEARTYGNLARKEDWIIFKELFDKLSIGKTFEPKGVYEFASNDANNAIIHFNNLKLKAFRHAAPTPTNLKATCNPEKSTVDISWDEVENASIYKLRLNFEGNDKETCFGSWYCQGSPDRKVENLTATKYNTTIIPEKKYSYWVHSQVNRIDSDASAQTFTCPLPVAKTAAEIKDDFDGELDLAKWNIWTNPAGSPTKSIIKDRAFVHYIPTMKDYVGLYADTKPISGDFDVTVELKPTFSTPNSSSVDLLFHDDSLKNSLAIVFTNHGGVYGYSILDQKLTNTEVVIDTPSPLSIRIIRIGSNVYYYYKSVNGYELLGSFAGIYSGAGRLSLRTTTNSPDFPEITGTFDNFVAKVNFYEPTPTPAATNSCGGTCGSNNNCNAGLVCYSGFCRNPQCQENKDCNCASAPSPTSTPKANTNTSKATPTPYRAIVDLKPTPVTSSKPAPKTDMRIYNLDLETPAPAPAPKQQSLFGKVVGFILKLFGIKY